MAVKLPDFTQLGQETGTVNAYPGSIQPRYPESSPEAAARLQLGTGLEKAGAGALAISSEAYYSSNLANMALAQADLHTKLARTKAQIEAENDPAKIDELYSQMQGHLDSSSQMIFDPRYRDLWKGKHATEIADAQLGAEKRQRTIYTDKFHAGVNQQADDKTKLYAQSDDPAVREQAVSDLHTLYGSLKGIGLQAVEVEKAERKAASNMILGRAEWLDAQNRPQEALDHLRANSTLLDPDDWRKYSAHLQDRSEVVGARTWSAGQRAGGGGGGGPRPEQNNPGNIKTSGGGWATFDTPEAGRAAIGDLLERHQTQHGMKTIRQLINDPTYGYAPDTDVGNKIDRKTGLPKDLVGDAARFVGIGPDDPIDLKDPAVREKMVQAILQQEGTRHIAGGASGTRDPTTNLDTGFKTALDNTIAEAAKNGITLTIGSGSRTYQRQKELREQYDKDVAAGKHPPPVAKPGSSQHEFGRAADLLDANGNTIRAGSPEDKFLTANADRLGIIRPVGGEPWHVEPAGNRGGTRTRVATGPAVTMTDAGGGPPVGPSGQTTAQLAAGATQPAYNAATGKFEQRPRPEGPPTPLTPPAEADQLMPPGGTSTPLMPPGAGPAPAALPPPRERDWEAEKRQIAADLAAGRITDNGAKKRLELLELDRHLQQPSPVSEKKYHSQVSAAVEQRADEISNAAVVSDDPAVHAKAEKDLDTLLKWGIDTGAYADDHAYRVGREVKAKLVDRHAAWLVAHDRPEDAVAYLRANDTKLPADILQNRLNEYQKDADVRSAQRFDRNQRLGGTEATTMVPPLEPTTPGGPTTATPAMERHIPLPEMLRRIEAAPELATERAKALARTQARQDDADFQSRHHAERVKLDQQMRDDLASRALTGVGHPEVTPQRVMWLEGPEVALTHQQAQKRATEFFGQTSDFSQLSRDELGARVTAMAPKPAQENFIEQTQRHGLALKKAEEILELRKSDAALAVAKAPEVEKAAVAANAALVASQAAPGDPARLQAYVAATQALAAAALAEQDRLGILREDQRVLTQSDAARFASTIANADPAKIDIGRDMMAPLAARYGEHFPKVMSELVKHHLPADAQALVMLTPEPGQPDTLAVVRANYQQMMLVKAAAGSKGGQEALESAAGAKAKDIKKQIEGDHSGLVDLRMTMPDQRQQKVLTDAIHDLALFYAGRSKDDGQAAYNRAYDELVTQRYDFEGPLRVPKGMLGVVERAGDAMKQNITPESLAPSVRGDPRFPPEYRGELMAEAIQRGVWVTNEADDGAVLYLRAKNGATVQARGADGNKIQFKFSEAPMLAEWAPERPGVGTYAPPASTRSIPPVLPSPLGAPVGNIFQFPRF